MVRWLSKKELRERRKIIVYLRDKKGLTWSQIAERLGISISTACHDYRVDKEGERD